MKKVTKVLVVGPADSIHLARWLSRFSQEDIEFDVFSINLNGIHPELQDLIKTDTNAKFIILNKDFRQWILGRKVLRLGLHRLRHSNFIGLNKIFARNLRLIYEKFQPDVVHLHCLQESSPIYVNSQLNNLGSHKLYLTNWGSDLAHFARKPKIKKFLSEVIARADFYQAECERDLRLASDFGFKGRVGEVVSTSFTFSKKYAEEASKNPSFGRHQIAVKCYGGELGKELKVITQMRQVLLAKKEVHVLLFSVSPDLYVSAFLLALRFPRRVRIWRRNQNHSNASLMSEFVKSRIYVGFSLSDGLSTSMLEAINCGSFAIQSDTSCCAELIRDGVQIKILPPSKTKLADALVDSWELSGTSDYYAENLEILSRKFSPSSLREKSRGIYKNA